MQTLQFRLECILRRIRYLEEWMSGVEARNAAGTIERYRHSVKLFLSHLGPKAKRPVTAVTPQDVESFLK